MTDTHTFAGVFAPTGVKVPPVPIEPAAGNCQSSAAIAPKPGVNPPLLVGFKVVIVSVLPADKETEVMLLVLATQPKKDA